jgi:hypothetical protein
VPKRGAPFVRFGRGFFFGIKWQKGFCLTKIA